MPGLLVHNVTKTPASQEKKLNTGDLARRITTELKKG